MREPLTLPEKLFLILQNRKLISIKLRPKYFQRVFVIGACFVELERREKIKFDDQLKVQVINTEPTQIPYLDEMLVQISKVKKERRLLSWLRGVIMNYWKANYVYETLIHTLLEKEIIQVRKTFISKSYVVQEPMEQQIVEEIRSAIFEDGKIDVNGLALILILDAIDVQRKWFSHGERKHWKERLEALKTEHPEEWKKVKQMNRIVNEVMVCIHTAAAT